MRSSFELIAFYMARRLLGLVARVIDRHPSQRSKDAQGGPRTPEPAQSLTDTKRGPRRAEQETP